MDLDEIYMMQPPPPQTAALIFFRRECLHCFATLGAFRITVIFVLAPAKPSPWASTTPKGATATPRSWYLIF